MLPLIVCFSVTALDLVPILKLFEGMDLLNEAIAKWLFPIVLIPLYQLFLYRCFHSFSSSMLQCIGVGLFMFTLGFILLEALGIVGEMLSGNEHRYLFCARSSNVTTPYYQLEWYWKLNPWILYSSGSTIAAVLFIEIIIAQSPDKMKGFVMGVVVFSHGFFSLICFGFTTFTLCWDSTISIILVVLFVVFLVLSKRYTLRERNREINIQAIVEEHYI